MADCDDNRMSPEHSVWFTAMNSTRAGHAQTKKRKMINEKAKKTWEMVMRWDRVGVERSSGRSAQAFSRTGQFKSFDAMRQAYAYQVERVGPTSGACEIIYDRPVWFYLDLDSYFDSKPEDENNEIFDLCGIVSEKLQELACEESRVLFNVFSCNRTVPGNGEHAGQYKVSAHAIFQFALARPNDARKIAESIKKALQKDGKPRMAGMIDTSVYPASSKPVVKLFRLFGAKKTLGACDDPSVLVFNPDASIHFNNEDGSPVAWVTIDPALLEKGVEFYKAKPKLKRQRAQVFKAPDLPMDTSDDDDNEPVIVMSDDEEVKESTENYCSEFIEKAIKLVSKATGTPEHCMKEIKGKGALIISGRMNDRDCFCNPGEIHDRIPFSITTDGDVLWYHCMSDSCKRSRVVCTMHDEVAHDKEVFGLWGGNIDLQLFGNEVRYVSTTDWFKDAPRVVGIQAGCGMGKSSAEAELINGPDGFHRSLYVVARTAQCSAWRDAVVKTAERSGVEPVDVVIYEERDNWTMANHIACTFQSLYKLVRDGQTHLGDYDVVYIDEACTLIPGTVTCTTTNKTNLKANNEALQYFMGRSKHVVMSDAHLLASLAVPDYIRHVFPVEEIRLCAFDHKAIAPECVLMDSSYNDLWFASATASMSAETKGFGFIGSSSKRALAAFDVRPNPDSEDSTVESFTGDTCAKRSKKAWSNPDYELVAHDGITASSSIAIGGDATIPCSRVYANIKSDKGADGRTMIQLCSRPRNNMSNRVYAMYDPTTSGPVADYDDILFGLRASKTAIKEVLGNSLYAPASVDWSLRTIGSNAVEYTYAPNLLVKMTARARQDNSTSVYTSFIRFGLRSGWTFYKVSDEMDEYKKCSNVGIYEEKTDDSIAFTDAEKREIFERIPYSSVGCLMVELSDTMKKGSADRIDKTYMYDMLRAMTLFPRKTSFEMMKYAAANYNKLMNLACFYVSTGKLVGWDLSSLLQRNKGTTLVDLEKRGLRAQRVALANEIAKLFGFNDAYTPGQTTTSDIVTRNAQEIINKTSELRTLCCIRPPQKKKGAKEKSILERAKIGGKVVFGWHGITLSSTYKRRIKKVREYTYTLVDDDNLTQVLAASDIFLDDRSGLVRVEVENVTIPESKKEEDRKARLEERKKRKDFDPRVTMFNTTLDVYADADDLPRPAKRARVGT